MGRRLRLVLVAPYPILPTSAGGKVRIVQLARALCRLGADVTIIAPYHVTQRRSLVAREPFTLHQVPYAPFLLTYLLVDRPFPYGALVSFHPGYRALLPVSLASFDVCQIDHPAFFDLVRDVPRSVPIVYGSQNVEFDYVSSESRPGLVRRASGERVRSLERELIERAARVFACTEGDRGRFRELYGAAGDRITVVPNGVDLAAVDAQRRAARRHAVRRAMPARLARRAIFAGSNVRHNQAAVRAILSRVAPQLEQDVEFVIVGPCARGVRGQGGNVVLDPEGDVADYAEPGVIGLNPVVQGSGSNLKLLHYLAFDLPVLSTAFGMRGFEDLSPWVLTAPFDDFAAALRRDPPEPHGVRDRLRDYDWNSIARKSMRAYETLAARRPSSD